MTIFKNLLILVILTLTLENTYASTIIKVGASDLVQERVEYAYKISNGNLGFIGTIDSENNLWTNNRRSNKGYIRNGKKYYDWGICQISEYYHPKITNNILFWTDWKWQMDKCWNLYKSGTKFYGSKNAKNALKSFKIVK